MSSENVFHETRDLPLNVLTLVDDDFYAFVEQRLGVYQSLLLKIQQINSVPCFLLTNDPYDDLNVLKTKICFPLENGSFIVKPGFKIGFTCLRDLLLKKTGEKMKQLRNTKPLSTTTGPINTIPSSSPSLTLPTTTLSIPDAEFISIAEHRRYFLNLLKLWCSNHKDEFLSESFYLKETSDFILNVLYNQNNHLKASVTCNCGVVIALSIKGGKIQLSNFQKHLRSTNCSHIRAIKKINEEQQKINFQQLSNTLSSLTSTTSKPAPQAEQQSALQVPIFASTPVNASSADTETPLSQTGSRKRGPSSFQVSSQKIKKNCI